MEKRADGMIEMEPGDEVLVVTARHRDGSTAIVGSFTGYRLAHVGARAYSDEYGRNGDGARGPVVSTEVFSTCLDQHGVCPQVSWSEAPPSAPPPLSAVGAKCVVGGVIISDNGTAHVPHPGPYTKELLESGLPDYAVLVGPSRVAESPQVVWDLFDVDASPDMLSLARGYVGLPVSGLEPEADHEVGGQDGDDLDAALSYLRSGGALCKVPDSPRSRHFRLLVVPFPGSPLRGNCA